MTQTLSSVEWGKSALELLKQVKDLDHYSPAVYLTENPKIFNKLASKEDLLNTFEEFFNKLNTLI